MHRCQSFNFYLVKPAPPEQVLLDNFCDTFYLLLYKVITNFSLTSVLVQNRLVRNLFVWMMHEEIMAVVRHKEEFVCRFTTFICCFPMPIAKTFINFPSSDQQLKI